MKRRKSSSKTSAATIEAVTSDEVATPSKLDAPVGDFPVVGIGASAGGLAAFEAFFSGMPPDVDPGMAFVLVQHLAPDHKSILSELIRRYTRMEVFEVEDGMLVKPNCAYIIPPGCDLAFLNGKLHLHEPREPRGQRLPIDFFFRSLAEDQEERAIGIVLSGTGSDGTLGVRAIKDKGGIVMAQNAASTEFDGMPRNAIATGLVDFQLPPAEMPAQLMAFTAHASDRKLTGGPFTTTKDENAIKTIFILLRGQTGHDFSLYKPSTMHRRFERRMSVHQIDTLEDYVKYLQKTPEEVEALFRDLLIGVTNFFRDPEAFQVLEDQVIPALFARRPSGAVIRAWSTGCSTGEEAYSLAILMAERMEELRISFAVQVFATDIDPGAIATARTGIYPASITADVSPERLARFFTAEPNGSSYRIHKGIRDMLVFSEQDVIKDPPFSKLDLISCRNLLIYMGSALQRKLIPLFHYALKPDSYLFLGTSEGVGEASDLFNPVDRKVKIFQRTEESRSLQRATNERFMPLRSGTDASIELISDRLSLKSAGAQAKSLRETTEQALLSQVIAAGALINAYGDIHYLHGRTGMFLEPSPGEASINNILKMARQGLRGPLRSSLRKAVSSGDTVVSPGLVVKTNGHFSTINLTIRPVTTGASASLESPLFLVILEEAPVASSSSTSEVEANEKLEPVAQGNFSPEAEELIAALREELSTKEGYLQSTNEELESSGEELKSSNEEMQSVNEELQSTNEELETSKEELQSLNEELSTVNSELQTKVLNLSRVNNDMNNLLAGTGIATVFVDHELRILRYTPAASDIINLILSDVGRPVGHIVSNLVDYTSLLDDMQSVLDTLVAHTVQVQTNEGKWYTMRIQPYRTLENVIEGAVISFVDVTEMVRTQGELTRTAALLRRTGKLGKIGGWELSTENMQMHFSHEALLINDLSSNSEYTLDQMFAMIDPKLRPAQQAAAQAAIDNGTPWDGEARMTTAKGRSIWVNIQGAAELKDGKVIKLHGTLQDITERKHAEDSLLEAQELLPLAAVVRDAYDAVTVQDLTGHTIAWNPGAVRLYGWSSAEAMTMNVSARIPISLRAGAMTVLTSLSRSEVLEPYMSQRLDNVGRVLDVAIISTALLDADGEMYAVATTERPRAGGAE
ncbi:MAG: two-component system CheB/CheR fusion protein [Planctomycetota bacterium]|jgi:two-component system CheB/CheR fusion protein